MNLYAVAIWAINLTTQEAEICAGDVLAHREKDAKREALALAREEFPPADGWSNWTVAVHDISKKHVREARGC